MGSRRQFQVNGVSKMLLERVLEEMEEYIPMLLFRSRERSLKLLSSWQKIEVPKLSKKAHYYKSMVLSYCLSLHSLTRNK